MTASVMAATAAAPSPSRSLSKERLTMKTTRDTCSLCHGNAGRLINGAHALCSARHNLGLATPNLGTHCLTCNGSGTTGRGGVMLGFDLGPAVIARSITAQFPPCPDCHGKG